MSRISERPPVGVEFTETMRGWISLEVLDDYRRGADRGRADGSTLEFTVTVRTDDVDAMVADPSHPARISGEVRAPTLSPVPLAVDRGEFHLFVEDTEVAQGRRMVYAMPMRTSDGREFHLSGHKLIHDDLGFDLWKDTTTLFVTLREGPDESGRVVGRGIVTIAPADFKKQMSTVRAVGASNEFEALRAVAVFGQFFAGVLQEIYGGPLAPSVVFDPDAPPRARRELRLPPPQVYRFDADDGTRLKLTRFRGGDKGPVILAPGFGTSGLAYLIDTVETNLPEYLCDRGYDVWVFDYRASPELPSSATEFTLDDIAGRDWPAAVAEVRRLTGRDSVQVMAHCVGSLSFLMAQALGLKGVRSAVSSALTLHPVPPLLNEIKSRLYLANFLYTAGVGTLSTDFSTRSDLLDRAFDRLLKLYPTRERCNSPVCRRILFMYGEVYDHDRLNAATHSAIHEMFGVANMTTFKHLTTILNAGHAVRADGADVYLAHPERFRLPITFIHGENNNLFRPEGSRQTYDFLRRENGDALYARHVIPDYAHMDCFIGKDSARDVFPVVEEALARHA
jgi:cholesterol oxidase